MKPVLMMVLIFEAIVLGLAIPVAVSLSQVSSGLAGGVGGGLAVLCLVAAGLVRAPGTRGRIGVVLGSALQVAAFALGFVVMAMFVLGLVFGAIWTWCLVYDRRFARTTGTTPAR